MGVEVSEVINILGERYNRVFQGAGSALPEPWIRFQRSSVYVLGSSRVAILDGFFTRMRQFFIFVVM